MNDYCADDHKHVVLVSIKMSERKRNSISIKSKYEILMKLKSGMKRDLIISEYNQWICDKKSLKLHLNH